VRQGSVERGAPVTIAGVSELTPSQLQTRERVEGLIRLAAPALDLVLAAGDRLSRIVEPEDYDYYPARPLGQALGPVGPEGEVSERSPKRSS
jgi:hypothetical protein